ncbi:MAG: hypothetical protein DRN27_05825 [Thermoplasmata archaeon]|nr:MAG: hypothetical protein DRN27_05825 [Thermoplasmata archaeon]
MIKQIFDEIANESSTNEKKNILSKYVENELLKRVLYLAKSKRVKFYIKQIPDYVYNEKTPIELDVVLDGLSLLSDRTVTGHNAITYLKNYLSGLSPDDAYVLERIIDKDLKIGMGTREINKIFPDLIEKTGYMGCKPFSKKLVMKLLDKGSCYSQEKMDGMFINSIIQGGEVQNDSRQGDPITLENPIFLTELAGLKDCVINGELVMEGVERYKSNGIITSLKNIAKKRAEGKDVTKHIEKLEKRHMPYQEALDLIRVVAWDILTIDEYYTRKCIRPYNERLAELNVTVDGFRTLSVVETREVSSLKEVMAHYEEIQSRDGEGTVVKSKDGVWKDTKPSYQIKIKKEINLDLRITGFNYGKAGTKNEHLISSVDVESEDGLLKTSPTGLSEDEMDYITSHQEELLGTILEIKCSGISHDRDNNFSVMHPVYKKPRTDKSVANTLAECVEIDVAASLL